MFRASKIKALKGRRWLALGEENTARKQYSIQIALPNGLSKYDGSIRFNGQEPAIMGGNRCNGLIQLGAPILSLSSDSSKNGFCSSVISKIKNVQSFLFQLYINRHFYACQYFLKAKGKLFLVFLALGKKKFVARGLKRLFRLKVGLILEC
jgi:hypothetical protein